MQYFLYIMVAALTIFFIFEIRRSLRRSKKTVELIDKYWLNKTSPQLIDEMFDFAINDRRLSKIVAQYNADRSDFELVYKKLLTWADFRKYNRFIPITSFFYAGALEYLLSHKNDDAKMLTEKMLNYFHI
ncbi:MAG: hypothetical protein IJ862_07570 [Selenomonadaceae bacterium]|nr:hypothetical protein [Selenomonadaceae bacterium]